MGGPLRFPLVTQMGPERHLRAVAKEQPRRAETAEASAEHSKFALNVVFTTWRGTMAALGVADRQSRSLGSRILLWYFQTVPSQFSTSCPPVSTDFAKRRLAAMARKCCRNAEVEIHICFCTDQRSCMRVVLTPESIVIAGGRRRWWSSREQRIAALLRSYGCQVLFVPEKSQPRIVSAEKEP
jgi:hypothetical protein